MRRFELAPGLALSFGALVLSAACSSETIAPLLSDCLDPSCSQPTPASPSPSARNRPPGPVDAGVPIVADGGIGQETLPEAGPGPGVGPSIGGSGTRGIGPDNSNELGPVCPALAPTNGAPCDPTANILPCSYARLTCSCVTSWLCI